MIFFSFTLVDLFVNCLYKGLNCLALASTKPFNGIIPFKMLNAHSLEEVDSIFVQIIYHSMQMGIFSFGELFEK